MSAPDIVVVMPAGALGASDDDTAVDAMLRRIGAAFSPDPDGEWPEKYGAAVDNGVFMMRPYCWCEREDCRWCSEGACGCPNPAPVHYVDGKATDYEGWYEWSHALLGPLPHEVHEHGTPAYREYSRAWDERVKERDRRSSTVYPARVHVCEPRGLMSDRPEGPDCKPEQTAPCFWFKPTGFKAWWYKYIGRSTKLDCPPRTLDELRAIEAACMAALTPGARP